MQKKKVICAGIGVAAVIAVIFGSVALHKDSEAVETIAETATPIGEEDSTRAAEEELKAEETEPQTEESTDEEVEREEPKTVQEEMEEDMAEVPEEEGEEEIDAYMYTMADLNMRKRGTTESEVIGSIPYGTEIHVTARTADNWYRTERGEIGYVSGKYLSDTKPQQNTSSQQASSGSSETTQPGGGSTGTQSGGGGLTGGLTSSQQSEIERMKAELSGLGSYTGPTSSPAGGGSGGRRLDGTNAWE